MSLHLGFSDSDDESRNMVKYECSDPDHCYKGDSCDGEHGYSAEYLRLRFGTTKSEESAAKSDVTVNQNPRSPPLHETVIQVPLDEYDAPPSPPSDPVEVAVVAPDPSTDDLDLDVEADSEDACSRS